MREKPESNSATLLLAEHFGRQQIHHKLEFLLADIHILLESLPETFRYVIPPDQTGFFLRKHEKIVSRARLMERFCQKKFKKKCSEYLGLKKEYVRKHFMTYSVILYPSDKQLF